MAQIINTNIMSLNAQRNLSATQSALATSVQRLSTGLRVNSAKDDAAGLAIAERMNTQVRGMNVAIRNANDAISLSQTAEDQALAEEIKRNLAGAAFNGTKLFATAAALTFQVGANAATTDQITINTENLAGDAKFTAVIGNNAKPDGIATVTAASAALGKLDDMLALVNAKRAEFGATQNRFEAVIQTLQVSAENQTAARSRIMDADFASETAALTRAQVLQQAGTSMLSQANSLPNNVLSLLR